MAWSITEVARMAGVTSRTLRHYDAVGLLAPAHVGANGYRYYEEEQLLRLQEVLLLRELGLGLETIAEVLAGRRDRVEALRHHEQRLRAEQQRLGHLADTVARTVSHLQGGTTMTGPDFFEGFAEQRARAEEALVDRYGDGVREHFATARRRTADWTEEDYRDAARQVEELDARMVRLLRSGAAPDADEVLDVVAEHHRAVARHWTPDRESYAGLGRLYVDDPQHRARLDAQDPGLAGFYRDALGAYAERRLA